MLVILLLFLAAFLCTLSFIVSVVYYVLKWVFRPFVWFFHLLEHWYFILCLKRVLSSTSKSDEDSKSVEDWKVEPNEDLRQFLSDYEKERVIHD